MEMEYSLQLQNLTKHYQDFTLDSLSFSLPKGSIMGLVGANGAGKSTTMKCILGLVQPDSGTVTVLGQPVNPQRWKNRADVGVVFDECSFPQILTPKELGQVLAGIYPGWDSPGYAALLSRLSLPPKKRIQEFSRGMRMKLSIAAALCHRARLLVLDEPTSGLDPIVRSEILDLFLEYLQDEECSVLISSHITSDLEKVADYITFLDRGRMLLTGSKDELIYGFRVAKGTAEQIAALPREWVAAVRQNRFDTQALVRQPEQLALRFPHLLTDQASLEDILLFLSA